MAAGVSQSATPVVIALERRVRRALRARMPQDHVQSMSKAHLRVSNDELATVRGAMRELYNAA